MKKLLNLIMILILLFTALLQWYDDTLIPRLLQDQKLLVKSESASETKRDVSEYEVSDDWLVFYDVGFYFSSPSNIERDTNGQMWINSGPIYRYDGENWYDCKTKVLDDLYGDFRALGVRYGKAYVGISGGHSTGVIGIYDTNTQHWKLLSSGSGQLSGAASQWGSIAIDTAGQIYFALPIGILDIYDGKNFERVPIPVPQKSGYLHPNDSLIDDKGIYWLATDDGIWEYSNKEWIVHPLPESANAITTDSKGRMWVATSDGVAVQDIDGKWYAYTSEHYPFTDTPNPMNRAWISDIAVDSLDRVWFTTQYKLYVFNGQDWQFFEPSVVGATRWTDAIAFDKDGYPWIAAQDKRIAVFRGQLKIGPFMELVDAPPLENIPKYELGPSQIAKPDSEKSRDVINHIMLALVVVSGVVQIIRTVRADSN